MDVSRLSPVLVVIVVVIAYRRFTSHWSHHASEIPFVGNSWFQFFTGQSIHKSTIVKNAYNTYTKKSKVFQISNMNGIEYIIPPSTFPEIRKAPESVLDTHAANEEKINLNPVLGDEYGDFAAFLTKDLNRNIPLMVPAIVETTHRAITRNFLRKQNAVTEESGETFYVTTIYPALLASLGSMVSRVFVGEKYSKDDIWIQKLRDFIAAISIQGVVLRRVPKFLKPLVTKLFPAGRRAVGLKEMLRDTILGYVANGGGKANGVTSREECSEDGLQLPLLIKFVQGRPGYENATDEQLLAGTTARMLAMFFATIETSAISFMQVFFDIICNPRAQFVEPMLVQIHDVLARNGGEWNSKALSELTLLDSFIKESQRLRPIGYFLSARKVLSPGGYTFQQSSSDGLEPFHLPQGSNTQLPVYAIQTDPSNYSDPDTFQGFRFAKDKVPSSQPNDKFLSFGYGRHACVGRYLALIFMKIIAIELMLNYEWAEMERPKEWSFEYNSLPDFNAKVTLRRKGKSNAA